MTSIASSYSKLTTIPHSPPNQVVDLPPSLYPSPIDPPPSSHPPYRAPTTPTTQVIYVVDNIVGSRDIDARREMYQSLLFTKHLVELLLPLALVVDLLLDKYMHCFDGYLTCILTFMS